jgi:hypothetical protein
MLISPQIFCKCKEWRSNIRTHGRVDNFKIKILWSLGSLHLPSPEKF